jgi:hypothetical protein
MRSEVSSWVGGAPGGTVTVGSVPKVPAGDRSAVGTDASVVLVVGGLDELDGELEHPARPRTEADKTTSDHVRTRDIERVPFRS